MAAMNRTSESPSLTRASMSTPPLIVNETLQAGEQRA